MITEIFEDSINYTFKDFKTFIKVGIISLFSFLIIPLFLLLGYGYRVTATGLKGVMVNSKDPLPKISPMRTLLKEGLGVFLVIFVYSLPSIILTILICINTGIFDVILTHSSFTITLNTGTFFLTLLLVIWFISFTLLTVAIPHMVENNNLKSAFKIREILKIIKFLGIVEYIKFYIITILMILTSIIVTFFVSQGIINIITHFPLLLIQSQLNSLIIGYLNIIIF